MTFHTQSTPEGRLRITRYGAQKYEADKANGGTRIGNESGAAPDDHGEEWVAVRGQGLSANLGDPAGAAILDAEAINVAPLNHVPGAVVSLMDRTNVETVIVAGKIRKWKGRMQDANLNKLRRELEESRDYLFARAGIQKDLFRAP